ncbi:MAG: hypothetical protein AB7O91_04140 [Sphingomonas sp.]
MVDLAAGPGILLQKDSLQDLVRVSVHLDLEALAAAGRIYASTSAGIADTVDGEYFFVVTAQGLQLYLNDSEVAVDQAITLPSADTLNATTIAVGRASRYGIADPVKATLFGAAGLELDFARGFHRYGLTPSSDDFADVPGYNFLRATAGTAWTAAGALVPFASGEPRVTDAGLLVEPGRTNKLAYYNANVAEAVAATSVAGLTPDGGLTLTVIDDTAAIAAAGLSAVCTSGKAVQVVNSSGSTKYLAIAGTTGNTNPHVISIFARTPTPFTGTVHYLDGASPPSYSVTAAYQRFSEVVTPAASNKQMFLRVANGNTIIFLLAGMEEGDFITSPIVTQGSAATRDPDRPIIIDLAFQSCTIVADAYYVNAASDVDGGSRVICDLYGGSAANRALLVNETDGPIETVVEVASVTTASAKAGGVAAIGAVQRLAVRLADDDVRIARNGELGGHDSDGAIPDLFDGLALGCVAANDAHGSVVIQRLTIIPFTLTDNELVAVTGGPAVPSSLLPSWRLERRHAAFSNRDSARTFTLGGARYIANGFEFGGTPIKDIWRSTDGLNFSLVNGSPPYEDWSAVIALENVIYAFRTEMWKSTDGGANFTKIVDPMPFSIETDSPVLVTASGKLLAIPGDGTAADGDAGVWEFDPGDDSWTQIYTAAWGGRFIPVAEEFDGSIFLYGGFDKDNAAVPPEISYPDWTSLNDLWRSDDDGETWTQVVANMPCQPRIWPNMIAFDGRLYLTGGFDNLDDPGRNFRDTWVSDDGIEWSRLEVSDEFVQRHAAVAYAHNGRLHVASGNANPNGKTMNDIWVWRPA